MAVALRALVAERSDCEMVVRKMSAKELLGGRAMVLSAGSTFGQQIIRHRIGKARKLATEAHANQSYGNSPYVEHLSAVVRILEEFGASPDTIVAGWLHDIVEDTSVSLDQIHSEFGDGVAKLVWAVTGEGHGDRQEHCASIYRKIGEYPHAAIVKLADRIANLEACDVGDKHFLRYSREHESFAKAIRERVPIDAWERYLLAVKSNATTAPRATS